MNSAMRMGKLSGKGGAAMDGLGDYFPFWNALTKAQRDRLAAAARERGYPKGAMLHRGGADCLGLLVVLSGRLRAYVLSEEGRELTLYRLLERDVCLLSAACMLRGLRFDVMVSAEADSRVLHIPAEVFREVMEESAPVANYVNALIAERFSDVMWLMDQVLNKKLDARLAAVLLEERALQGSGQLSLTHEQLGGHLGSPREVVTRMLRYFQEEGLVELGRGRLRILDLPGLEALAEGSLR